LPAALAPAPRFGEFRGSHRGVMGPLIIDPGRQV
jgi:hypothetical protein